MRNTDLDWLCSDASPEEVKRLMRITHEWSQGDEHSFPVQLALLTRSQWRAAAKVPVALDESRRLMDLKLAEYRQQTAALVKQLSETATTRSEELTQLAAVHAESLKQAVASGQCQLASAESIARQIRSDLERGMAAWNAGRSEYESERRKLEVARDELDARNTIRDWLFVGLVALLLAGIGFMFGWHMPR